MKGFRLDIFGEDISGSERAVAIARLSACR
jgi:hypothetical protein